MGAFSFLLFIALVVSALLNAVLVFRHVWRGPSRFRTIAVNTSTFVFASVFIFIAVEFYFRVFFFASGAFSFTQASKAWFREYWTPVNSLGYRDDEPVADASVKTVVVVGDSLPAGHGIDDYRERFGDRLEQALGVGWDVATVAQCGWDTGQELEALKAFPIRPHAVVLSYCVNDLDGAARAAGHPRPPVPPPGRLAAALTDRFCSLDFLYWQWVRGSEITESMWKYYDACYRDPAIWERHRHELAAFAEYVRGLGVPLYVVVFPLLTDVARTERHNDRVIAFVEESGATVIDMTDVVRKAPPGAYVVSALDGHPNPMLHGLVAQRLYAAIAGNVAHGS
jgi:hypothetical protein